MIENMTDEQAAECLKTIHVLSFKDETATFFLTDVQNAFKLAIKALEQQPSEDCISREAIEKLKKYRFSYDTNTTIPKSDIFVKIADIKRLPSVTLQPKVGKWIIRPDRASDIEYRCSECGKIQFADDTNELNYCCNCGSKMEVSE